MSAVIEAALATALRRDRLLVAVALAAITALAWGYTLWLAASMDMGMEMNRGASTVGRSATPGPRGQPFSSGVSGSWHPPSRSARPAGGFPSRQGRVGFGRTRDWKTGAQLV